MDFHPWFITIFLGDEADIANNICYLSGIPFIVNGVNIIPVKSYLNADLDKKLVYDENKNKKGIYIWTNLTNNKCYIGSSSDLRKRFSWYYSFNNLNKLGEYSTSLICRAALLKYGHENFRLKFLCSSTKSSGVVPVKMYANADTQKAQILKENRKCAGVYRWTYLPSGNCYIGSSINLVCDLTSTII